MNPESDPPQVLPLLRDVAGRVAPVWPLDRFVAVNPYLGLLGEEFDSAATLLGRVGAARMTADTRTFERALSTGTLDLDDLERVITDRGSAHTSSEIVDLLEGGKLDAPPKQVETVADVLDRETGSTWNRFMREHLGSWFASFFDEGYARWQPSRSDSLFATWKAEAEVDRTPEILGARGFRRVLRALPSSVEEASRRALVTLELSSPTTELYLHRLLLGLGGWSATAARMAWERRLHEEREDDTPAELLAVLLAFEGTLYESLATPALRSAWRRAAREASAAPDEGVLEARVLLQLALERGHQRRLAARLRGRARPRAACSRARAAVQSVFCIDVRSEVFRRHLESADPTIETFGFAGFFGFPVDHVPLAHDRATPHCPVLLTPTHRVREAMGDGESTAQAEHDRRAHGAFARAWRSFKSGAVSSLGFVSPLGLTYLPKLLASAFGGARPQPHPATAGLGRHAAERTLDLEESGGDGIPLADRVELAASALSGMSLTQGFARLVMLAGHGATSANNPHASGLDCGACGGQTGEVSARIAATVLNDADVRRGLRERGIEVPGDTFFLAALHDTTTDDVTILNHGAVPASHRADLERLQSRLAQAAATCRMERTRRLPPSARRSGDAWLRRSRDWAQVRPEWGLAGCAAMIVAPREKTRNVDLEGRAFLHSYDWRDDRAGDVLETIMTAPMVVASWINLQYYASTVDPDLFGAGNKTLHNVVGGSVGVLEGNGGDLRVGLPWQSLHDGERLQHEPLRLSVLIEAPVEAMTDIIARHETLRHLLDHGWIHLLALSETGEVTQVYGGDLTWREFERAPRRETEEAFAAPARELELVS